MNFPIETEDRIVRGLQEMSKKLPGFKDIIGLYAEDETAVSTVEPPDLQQFTQDEIAVFCRKLEDLHGIAKPGGMIFVKARQIIRQLQAELTIDDLSAPVFTSPTGPEGQG